MPALIGWTTMFAITVVGGNLLRGWVLTVMWGWFVVPVFHLPALSVVPAIGLAIVASYLTHQSIDIKSPERTTSEKVASAVGAVFIGPLCALAFAWGVHLFMPGAGS